MPMPPLELLDAPTHSGPRGYSASELESLSRLLELKLADFGITAEVVSVYPGPFVALDCTPGAGAFLPHFTLGGLDTTVDGAVLNSEGVSIGGLYAAGRTACGVPRRGDGYASGSSVGDATFSGRRAGRHAATH